MRSLVCLVALASMNCTLFPIDSTGGNPPPPDSDGGVTADGGSGGGGILAVDCRNSANYHTTACTPPTTFDPKTTTIGSGPHFVDTLDAVHPGFTDVAGDRIIVGLRAGSASVGAILAVDVTTGARTVISGPGVGTGTALPEIWAVQPGPDGWYALANGSVWRVDPKTGNRTKVWDTTMAKTECTTLATAGVAWTAAAGGLAIASDGTMYLPFMSSQGTNLGAGLVSIKGTTCKLVSHTGYPTSINHGTGPDVLGIKNQLSLEGSTLYSLSDGFVGKVDLVTGNRTTIANKAGTDTFVTADGKVAWTACNYEDGGQYLSVDLTSGTRSGIDPQGTSPLSVGGPWCTVWAHPSLPLLVVEDAKGFALFDPSNGNSNVLSY